MRRPGKFNRISILTTCIKVCFAVVIIFSSLNTWGQNGNNSPKPVDTVPKMLGKDLVTSIDTVGLKFSKDSLDAQVEWQAEDSVVIAVQEKKIYLYGKTQTQYQDIQLSAPTVVFDQSTQVVSALNRKDSVGRILQKAEFKQGENKFESDTIRFNFKTQKGITSSTYTQQGEMFVFGEKVKKINADEFYSYRGSFTTCNLDHPHFAFRAKKLKLVNKKLAVTGPIRPEFDEVPVPIWLPFGLFPLSQGRHSGILPPSFTDNAQYGVGLEGLGYYKVLNDYIDLKVQGNVYSYGGYSVNVNPTYRVRYRYNGDLSFNYLATRINFKGDPDYIANNAFFVNWNHRVDNRARPGVNFSANVRAGSTSYNQFIPNNPSANINNQFTSSIAYSKNWVGKPYTLTVNANHSQNSTTRLMELSLPEVGFVVNTIYPFQKKEAIGTPKWYEKLGVGYNGIARNQINFYDTAFSFQQIIDTLQWGAQHNVPIVLSLPQLGPLQIAPNITYEERWYDRQYVRQWNSSTNKLDTFTTKGFFTDRSISTGLSVSTAIFGTANFRKGPLSAIKHTVRPQVSVNYKPDLSGKYYYRTQVDTAGNFFNFSRFQGTIFGAFAPGEFGGMSFGVDNLLEAKVRSKKDTSQAPKKIRLLDGFGFNGSYNFLADSFRLSPINIYLRSTLFEKINITATGNLDPYKVNASGFPINEYAWQGGTFSLGRITNFNVALSTSLTSKKAKEEEKKKQKDAMQQSQVSTLEEQMLMADYIRRNPAQFTNFNIPWQANIQFSYGFLNRYNPNLARFEGVSNATINLQGDFSLTPRWKVGSTMYYNFDTKAMQSMTMFLSRELHCWQLSINITPVGPIKFYSLNINPRSGILQDLKVNRTRSFTDF